MKPLMTRVPDATYKRVSKLAAAEGLSMSKWLLRLVMVASSKDPTGQEMRSKVAQTLAGPEKGS